MQPLEETADISVMPVELLFDVLMLVKPDDIKNICATSKIHASICADPTFRKAYAAKWNVKPDKEMQVVIFIVEEIDDDEEEESPALYFHDEKNRRYTRYKRENEPLQSYTYDNYEETFEEYEPEKCEQYKVLSIETSKTYLNTMVTVTESTTLTFAVFFRDQDKRIVFYDTGIDLKNLPRIRVTDWGTYSSTPPEIRLKMPGQTDYSAVEDFGKLRQTLKNSFRK